MSNIFKKRPIPEVSKEIPLTEELKRLRMLLDKSLNAHIFTEAVIQIGFKVIREDLMGLKMENENGVLMLCVFQSIHPTNIGTLVYLDKVTRQTTCLVDGGKRQY
jgi:hypothetical protein